MKSKIELKSKFNFIKLANNLFLFVVLLGGLFFYYSRPILADDEEDSVEEQLEDLEEEEEKIKKKMDSVLQEKTSLQNHINLVNLQIQGIQNNIKKNEDQIERSEEEMQRIDRQILDQEKEIEKKKDNLREMIQLYYQIDKELMFNFLSAKVTFSDVLNQSEYLDQTSDHLKKVIDDISQKKLLLAESKKEYESKVVELEQKKSQLDNQVDSLAVEKANKAMVLQKTQGKEEKYKDLLQRIDEQKQELLSYDDLSDFQKMEVGEILKKADKPDKDDYASEKWYYSQKDKAWAYSTIGVSNSLMKDYGCAVTSLAMVFTYHDEDIKPGKLCKKPIFYQDLIMWPTKWEGLELTSSTAHSGVSWSKVKDEIDDGNPVIVFVRARAGKGHYVVIHGKDKDDYIVHDPLFGPNIYLGTTKKLVSAIYGTSTVVDQMIIYKED